MTVTHRPHVGFEVRCDARGCPATTAGAPKSTHSEAAALAAARALLWVEARICGSSYWVCPMQQTRDLRLGRWVPQPGAIRPKIRHEPADQAHNRHHDLEEQAP